MLNGLYLGSHAVLLLILKIITFDFLSGRPAIRQTFHLLVFTFFAGRLAVVPADEIFRRAVAGAAFGQMHRATDDIIEL